MLNGMNLVVASTSGFGFFLMHTVQNTTDDEIFINSVHVFSVLLRDTDQILAPVIIIITM